MRILKKMKREWTALLSKIHIRSIKTDYLGLPLKVPLIYGMRNGGYIVPAEFWMSNCLESFVKTKTGCVIDIGANTGLYLVKLKAISDKVDYYGVDSNPACIFYTQELIRLNQFKQAKIFTTALSHNNSIVDFYTNRRDDRMGSLLKNHHQYKPEFSFSTLTMTGDSLVDMLKIKQISAIKIDVEGAELRVLQGMQKTIEQYRPYLYIEILFIQNKSDAETVANICNLIQKMDYSILGVNLKTQKTEVIQDISRVGIDYECNYVFAPSSHLEVFIDKMKKLNSPI
jgi:FkbM family methyltransferase